MSPMGIKPVELPGTTKVVVPGIPHLDTRFVEIAGEIHETWIVDDYPVWDREVVANGDSEKDLFKTEQNKNDLQHKFPAPHSLVESGKFAEVQYLKVDVVQSRLLEMDMYSLIQGGYLSIKHKGDTVFRDILFYLSGGRQFGIHADAPAAAAPSVFFGDMSYVDLRSKFKTMVFKGGATVFPKAYWPGNVALTADKILEFRMEILELSPLVFLKHQRDTRDAA